MQFDVMNIVYYLAVILLATKLLGMVTRKLGLPQVVGMVIAGLLIGPSIVGLIFPQLGGLINPTAVEMDVLRSFSQIGVILILFSSGLETDFGELKKSGFASTMIAIAGVIVPIALGTLTAIMFMGGFGELANHQKLMNALFIGVILAATSVGITVETLRELGRLNTRLGTTVLSAAIIDDVIGIIALSVITGLQGGSNILLTLLKAAGFFVFIVVVGIPLRRVFQMMVRRAPHSRRLGIFALGACFLFSFCSERFFGIAAITGAYMAGLLLSGTKDTRYVDKKVLVNGYMIFSPIFFAFIGISADFSRFQPSDLIFCLVFVAVGILGKIGGCSLTARACRYSGRESLTIGCGMIARGEVALAVYATGSSLIYFGGDGSILGIDPLVATIMLIVITSILCPVLLKIMYRSHHHNDGLGSQAATAAEIDTSVKEGGYISAQN